MQDQSIGAHLHDVHSGINQLLNEFEKNKEIPNSYYQLIKTDIGFRNSFEQSFSKMPDAWKSANSDIMKHAKQNNWGFVYVVEGTHKGHTSYKIGKANDVDSRVKLFSVKIPFDIKLVMTFFVSNPYELELRLHNELKNHRAGGEWFNIGKKELDYIFLFSAAMEYEDSSKLMLEVLNDIKRVQRMPDDQYIEYLEAMLVGHGITFDVRG